MSYILLVRCEVTGMVQAFRQTGEDCELVGLFYFFEQAFEAYPNAFTNDDDFFESMGV